jgi:hypothetical protein
MLLFFMLIHPLAQIMQYSEESDRPMGTRGSDIGDGLLMGFRRLI